MILKSVTRPALRGAAILVLEPVIRAGMKKVIGRFTPENYETTAK
ncbi:phage shock protein D [Morganella morganii]